MIINCWIFFYSDIKNGPLEKKYSTGFPQPLELLFQKRIQRKTATVYSKGVGRFELIFPVSHSDLLAAKHKSPIGVKV